MKELVNMECKKCNSQSYVVLRKKDNYCKECFITSINHKFRSCLGKNRVLTANENVLLALSGGLGSSVLLELVHGGINLSSHKKLRINPICLHITGFDQTDNAKIETKKLIQTCKNYNLKLYIVHESLLFQDTVNVSEEYCIPESKHESLKKFNAIYESCQPTSQVDFLNKLRRNTLLKAAILLNCSSIFTAETTTTLASNLLGNLAIGRGAQIEYDIGFGDQRNSDVNILRPMKDISHEELILYAQLKEIQSVKDSKTTDHNSLQSLINSFVVNLQDNFQATISTLCKTADKIGTYDSDSTNKCVFCQSCTTSSSMKLTAKEATLVSSKVCLGISETLQLSPVSEQSQYCYGCLRNLPLDKIEEVITM